MGERSALRRRVLVEDIRRDGHHLRVTWHPAERQFVVSTWHKDVCTGAARVSSVDAAELTRLLVDGLAEAATAAERPSRKLPATKPGLAGLFDRLRWLVSGTSPRPADADSATAGCATDAAGVVRPLRRRSA